MIEQFCQCCATRQVQKDGADHEWSFNIKQFPCNLSDKKMYKFLKFVCMLVTCKILSMELHFGGNLKLKKVNVFIKIFVNVLLKVGSTRSKISVQSVA